MILLITLLTAPRWAVEAAPARALTTRQGRAAERMQPGAGAGTLTSAAAAAQRRTDAL